MKLQSIIALLICLGLAIYLVLPSPRFPARLPGSMESTEPADTESVYRRSYYTDLSRDEVMQFYFEQFGNWGERLNYPPEEGQTIIRDQTRSSYLEEFVHPGRESLYVNGFVPILPQDMIVKEGVPYLAKVTIRYFPSHPISRLTVLLMCLGVVYLLMREHGLAK